ncbi:hypothetical protein HETIRDRAFT_416087 [Heterobasidion irregulare TC 32-1]|uniref:RlpA-like protein double-psi beta-barrel domain-containing protein n=1 Tax=Heterobasidion irregulare (strain TC 32-1) TaxID=747525 RepID=W4KH73_HETIT|nr:uncharacterized protein HETIRDRAFT_416087 [Heterobasidion irregulare TC 32-1]ETW84391.1 hypothetical protein HETIRDRAFT_416087 [Heterobasidion irregulare TC 32-1]
MLRLFTLSFLALYPALSTAATAGQPGPLSPAELRYSRSHSLGENYIFDNRDGWQSVNISDMLYKYSTSTGEASQIEAEGGNYGFDSIWKRSGKNYRKNPGKRPEEKSGGLGGIADTVKNMFKGLKGIGKAQDVTITWYTGHDLENPSCWSESQWAPTDASFACALTMDGWQSKPQCFKFLELCNTPKKCVFVRVVDTCAGCAKGSKHVDLTKAAFGQLADFDKGVLTVQMRMATEPESWIEKLWGPKAK